MSIRDGYEMCYFGSTEYNRINNQKVVNYISTKYGRTIQFRKTLEIKRR